MDFGLYEMKIVRNNPSSVKSDHRLTRTNDLSPLGSDLSEVYCIYIFFQWVLSYTPAHQMHVQQISERRRHVQQPEDALLGVSWNPHDEGPAFRVRER